MSRKYRRRHRRTSLHYARQLFMLLSMCLCLQRHDDASQQSMSNSGTPKWAEVDEPMDFSQPVFGDAMPPQQDLRRVGHPYICPEPHVQHDLVVVAAANSLYTSSYAQSLSALQTGRYSKSSVARKL